MDHDIEISGHAGFTMGPVARWVCVNSDGFTVAYVDTIERAQRLIRNAAAAEREAVLVEALTEAIELIERDCSTPDRKLLGVHRINPEKHYDIDGWRRVLATISDTKGD